MSISVQSIRIPRSYGLGTAYDQTMLFTTSLVTAILAAFQFHITHGSFTHATRSIFCQFRGPLHDGSQPWAKLESSAIEKSDPAASLLEPRVIGTLPLPNHWTVALESYTAFLNGAIAMDLLTGFFAAIEAHASARQNQLTQLPAVSFQLGDIEVVFYSAIGTVPWSFVQNFAVLMQAVTMRGLHGFFQARATHLSGVVVFVDLRLI